MKLVHLKELETQLGRIRPSRSFRPFLAPSFLRSTRPLISSLHFPVFPPPEDRQSKAQRRSRSQVDLTCSDLVHRTLTTGKIFHLLMFGRGELSSLYDESSDFPRTPSLHHRTSSARLLTTLNVSASIFFPPDTLTATQLPESATISDYSPLLRAPKARSPAPVFFGPRPAPNNAVSLRPPPHTFRSTRRFL